MTAATGAQELASRWTPRLDDVVRRVRRAAREAMGRALREGRLEDVYRTVGEGAGDATFGLDVATERAIDEWLDEVARAGPVSLLTEESGWRHRGPAPGGGGPAELEGFDHGGPRIVIDPVDGTRNLMLDLRSAWTVVALAGPGPELPRQRDVLIGALAELPDSRTAVARDLWARRGAGCWLAVEDLRDGRRLEERRLHTDGDDRPDHGYFPFFAFHPEVRPHVAALGAEFFRRLERDEGAAIAHCYDDQYISSGGQLALTALGTYRMVVEARSFVARCRGRATQTCKPYDVAGAVLCAEETGCAVRALDGSVLDFPLDVETPVDFVAYANEGTCARLGPHLEAALEAFGAGG